MTNGSNLWLYLVLGPIIGGIAFLVGRELLQYLANWMLSPDPIPLGGVDPIFVGVGGALLGWPAGFWLWLRQNS